jgi:hypothetical protein
MPAVVLSEGDRLRVRYVGDRPVTITGPVTGARYSFSEHQRNVPVDPRDALALIKVRDFRVEGIEKGTAPEGRQQ